jgi:hypothetical protein
MNYLTSKRNYEADPNDFNKQVLMSAAVRENKIHETPFYAEWWRISNNLQPNIDELLEIFCGNDTEGLKFAEIIINPTHEIEYYRFIIDDRDEEDVVFYDHMPHKEKKHSINNLGHLGEGFKALEERLNG